MANRNDDISKLAEARARSRGCASHDRSLYIFARVHFLSCANRRSGPAAYMSTFFGSNTSTAVNANAEKDVEVSEPPGDSISSLSFSPVADFLAVGSWNNEVRLALFFQLSFRSEWRNLWIQTVLPLHRFGYTRLTHRMDKRGGKRCTNIKDLC